MGKVISFPVKKVDSYADWKAKDTKDRIEATKGVFKEAWPIIFFPFGLAGLLFGLPGFLVGCSIGSTFLLLLMSEMRYGKAM